MTALATTTEPTRLDPRRSLIGLISEYRELSIQLAEHLDLLVIESDPLSGTSALLSMALEDAERPALAIDARNAGDALDLAMAIATAAVSRLAPRAAGWWNGTSSIDVEGLRLSHALAGQDLDLDDLRLGGGSGTEQLRHAFELAAALTSGPVLVAIDHLDDLLERLNAQASRELLGVLRADHQRAGSVQQLLAGRTDGRLASGLRDPDHPLYRAGPILRIRRPRPHRFVDDLAIERAWTAAPSEVIGAAAELAAGTPAYVWRIVDAVTPDAGHSGDYVLDAWRQLRHATEPATAQQFRLLASTHRAAPTVACAIALGVGPYELPLNPKSVNDALTRMRARGQVFSPEKQRWVVSDPLLSEWAREHAPVWVYRRAHAG